MKKTLLLILTLTLTFGLTAAPAAPAKAPPGLRDKVSLRLTLLHNNDSESQLINAGGPLSEFGGVARFVTLVNQLRTEAEDPRNRGRFHAPKLGALVISSGDNFLAGPEFNASLKKGFPYYDSIALSAVGYDAITIGNHEFDFGPDVLVEFIAGFEPPVPFLSANLDVSGEPDLTALRAAGWIAPSAVFRFQGELVGVIGATTPRLPSISSPRNVLTGQDVAGIVQAEIDRLTRRGVKIIILSSHLQSLGEDLALLLKLRGVDIAIAGGGSELLANPWNLLLPGDTANPALPYPLWTNDAQGRAVPVVTTTGDYRYVGRLVAGFDKSGNLVAIDAAASGPVRVAGGNQPDAVAPDPFVQATVVEPVAAEIAALDQTLVAFSAVPLDGRRISVRGREANLGNLVADSLLWQARGLAAQFGVPAPVVALQNGGGIRNNNLLPAGDLSELDTFSVLPFANFVSVVPGISPAQFKELLENAVSRVEFGDGRFAQIAGFRLVYDPAGTPQLLDLDGNVTQAGTRVRRVELANGGLLVDNGAVVPGAPAIGVATIDFLARGGDQYPFRDAAFTTVGVTYQQALRNYLVNDLGGLVTAADYPEAGSGRIATVTP